MGYLLHFFMNLQFSNLILQAEPKDFKTFWSLFYTKEHMMYVYVFIFIILFFELTRLIAKWKISMVKLLRTNLTSETIYMLKRALLENDLKKIESFVESNPRSVKWIFEFSDKDYPADVSLLYLAVIYNKIDIVKFLIAKGADVNIRAGIGDLTPLEVAIVNKNIEMTELLLSFGAKHQLKCFKDEIPQEIITLLSDSHHRRKYKDLFEAVENSSILGVREHIKKGIMQINKTNAYGQTPLHIAAIKGCREITKILISNGADVNAKDEVGNTPLKIAIYYGHKDVESILHAHGAVIEESKQ